MDNPLAAHLPAVFMEDPDHAVGSDAGFPGNPGEAVRNWIEVRFGVACVYTLMERLRLKVPPPRHPQADPQAQAAWKKGACGVLECGRVEVGAGDHVGVIEQVCRVWVPPKVVVRQAVQYSRKHTYVAVAIDPLTGRRVGGTGQPLGIVSLVYRIGIRHRHAKRRSKICRTRP